MDATHPVSNERSDQERLPQSAIDQQARQIDLVSLFWRRKWLLVIGLMTGLVFGFLYYSKQPPVFESYAQVQIVQPYSKNLPVEGIDASAGRASNTWPTKRS